MIPDRLAFIDLETTGANPAHDRITEIGIVEVDGGQVSRWNTLVNPERTIPEFIQRLTGISNAMVADAPTFDEVAAELGRRLQGRLFVAHNARFDYGFVRHAFQASASASRPTCCAPCACRGACSRSITGTTSTA